MNTMLGILMVLVGLFAMAGSAFNWNWYWERRRMRIWVDLLGRPAARVVFGILGLAVLVVGVLVTAGVIQLT
jgi:hypothetical protein